jgi:hypothetical protein
LSEYIIEPVWLCPSLLQVNELKILLELFIFDSHHELFD